ncbi:MAG TPA: Lrp/AsnC ligand binding domain-containing protein [bacterium]|jgi:Lrp/AsnC family transcriptional regulator for asnA, asnC and gidA|nr:Lrp/AsnC ligand binding domain-containing protein [bacterium]
MKKYPYRPDLDERDFALITLLQLDGRMPLTELGGRLGVTHATVRSRLERLRTRGIIRITAVADPSKVGFPTQVILGIVGNLAHMPQIEKQLTQLEEVSYVATTTGRLDFIVVASFGSDTDLREFLVHKLSKIEGIRSTETFHILSLGKRVWQWRLPSRRTPERRPVEQRR